MRRLPLLGFAVVASFGFGLVRARPAAAADCGDLMIVLDRSGSMAGCEIDMVPKEKIAKDAITTITTKFSATPMGLFVFPDTLMGSFDACAIGKTVVDMAADGPSKVATFLSTMPTSSGGTPTGSSMEVVRDYAGWTPGKTHYVVIITDGQPTCDDGYTDAAMSMMCNGMGLTECTNPTRVYDAIQALHDKTPSIHTFVIGFAGMGSGLGCGSTGLPFDPDTLNEMADRGGEAQTGTTHYYSATDAASLNMALEKILGTVVSGTVGGCSTGGTDAGAGAAGGGGTGGAGGAGAGSGGAGAGGTGADGGTGNSDALGGGVHKAPAGCNCALASEVGEVGERASFSAGALLALALALAINRKRRAS